MQSLDANLEVVCAEGDDVEQESGHVDSHEGAEEAAAEGELDADGGAGLPDAPLLVKDCHPLASWTSWTLI